MSTVQTIDPILQFQESIEHIGSITQVGNTHVFGLARCPVTRQRTDLVYLNVAGPATAVEAVWAQLAQRKRAIFQPLAGGRGIFIQHGGIDKLEGSPFTRFQRRIPGLAIEHLILLDKRMTQPTYSERGETFAFDLPGLAEIAGRHVRRLVDLAVFPQWFGPLVEAGKAVRLISPCLCTGKPILYRIDLDKSRWQRLISQLLEKGELSWPC